MVRDGWYWFIRNLARVVGFQIPGGLRVRGLENVPAQGPVIVAPNHLSNLDPPVIAATLKRKVAFMAKEELFRVRLFGTLIRSLNAFPVRRGEGDSEAIRRTIERLDAGELVLVFPEGTRGDGKTLGPFNRGVGMLAKRTDAAVVPVGIAGTERKLPRGSSFPRLARVTVVYGPPLRYADYEREGARGARDAFGHALREAILEACREAGLSLRNGPEGSQKDRCDSPTASEPQGPAEV